MSSAQSLREFIMERLTAAAEEIFTEVDKTIVQYEEELGRQRRLLEICWKPQIQLQRIDLTQHFLCKETVPTDWPSCTSDRSSSLDREGKKLQMKDGQGGLEHVLVLEEWEEPEAPQIKEEPEMLLMLEEQEEPECPQIKEEPQHPQIMDEQEKLCISLEKKQETHTVALNHSHKEKDHTESDSNTEQLIIQVSAESEDQNQERNNHEDLVSSRDEELKQNMRCWETRGHRNVESVSHILKKKTLVNEKVLSQHCFKRHMTNHTAEKPFSCVTCGKCFSQRGHLTKHEKTHRNEKPFSCLTCGKCFSQRGHLTKHEKTHRNEKPFSCLTCGRCFRRSCHLTIHMRTHTGEKPFSCVTCGKCFSQISSLNKHLRSFRGLSHVRTLSTRSVESPDVPSTVLEVKG